MSIRDRIHTDHEVFALGMACLIGMTGGAYALLISSLLAFGVI